MSPLQQPPDEEQLWVDVVTAAAVLGVGPSAVRERIRLGHLPSTLHDGRRWLRLVDVQVAANVKAFRAEMRAAGYIVRQH